MTITNMTELHTVEINALRARIEKLENCTQELDVYEREIKRLRDELYEATNHAGHLELKINILKEERDDQAKEIIELKEERDALLNKVEWQTKRADGNWDACQRAKADRDAFKYESDNQAAAWKEIKTFIPDVNGLSLVDMVRKHVEELQAELNDLKANNRYQKGYGDGATAILKQVREMAAKLKP